MSRKGPSDPRWEASVELEVPFHDVDAATIVWHGHYYKYFEIARTALMRKLDYDVPAMRASGFAWPVIDSRCRYVSPLRYGQRFTVRAWITEYEHRLVIRYDLTDNDGGQRVARGTTTQVAVEIETLTMRLTSPPALLERLSPR